MGTGSSPPPPSALRGPRWGHFTDGTRWIFLPAELRPSRSCVEASVPSTVPSIIWSRPSMPESCSSFSSLEPLRTRHAFLRHIAPAGNKLEGLRQATFRRTGASPQVRRTVHPSGGYLERPAASGWTTGRFQFRWKDYAQQPSQDHALVARSSSVDSCSTFCRKGFQRIRYYGFLANRYPGRELALCGKLLQIPPPAPNHEVKKDYRDRYERSPCVAEDLPQCHHGKHDRHRKVRMRPVSHATLDTS